MTATNTFLLGVGCQKGGTTWLHDYLGRSPQVDLGFAKEYHVFDALDLPFCRAYQKIARAKMRKLLREPEGGAPAEAACRKLQFYLDPDSYFDYFHYLLLRDPKVRLTADITPTYAGLSPERLAFVRDGFAARGVAVKAIFLMRDPVERIWSGLRMMRQLHPNKNPRSLARQGSEEEALLAVYKKPSQMARTRYDLTVANLERVFAPEEVHVEFYERLFTEPAVTGLTRFLGIDPVPADFARRLNASPKTAEISERTRAEVARHYRPVYESLCARFGTRTVAGLWPSMRVLGDVAASAGR